MAKRRSKQDVGAKQDALPIDYSQADWSKIEEPIRAIGKSLSNEVREKLLENARFYRTSIRLGPSPEQRRDWQKIVQLSEHLHQALSVMFDGRVDYSKIRGELEKSKTPPTIIERFS